MQLLGPSSEEEMVLTFHRAEIDAPRYHGDYLVLLPKMGRVRANLIDAPDLTSAADNQDRARLLGLRRGYGLNERLFRGFPSDITWQRYHLSLAELGELRYANYPALFELSGLSRRAADGAARILQGPTRLTPEAQVWVQGVLAVAHRINAGEAFPELNAVRDTQCEGAILLDGHTRATACVIASYWPGVTVLLGTSKNLHRWSFF